MSHVMQSRPLVTQGCTWLSSRVRAITRHEEPPAPPVDDERFEKLRRRCPLCGELGLRIVYGIVSPSLMLAAARRKVVIGGCTHRGPTHRCLHGHEWHASDAPY